MSSYVLHASERHERGPEQRGAIHGKRVHVPSYELRIVAPSGSSSISSTMSIKLETSEKNGSSSGKRCVSSRSEPGRRIQSNGCTYGLTSLSPERKCQISSESA